MVTEGQVHYGWDAPSIVSADGTVQRLVADHVEVRLTGQPRGFSDFYLLSILELEHDDNHNNDCVAPTASRP